MKNLFLIVLSLLCAGDAQSSIIPAQTKQPPVSKTLPASQAPAAAAPQALTPTMIYTASNLRDPFRKASAGSSSAPQKPFKLSDFNIHNLILHGLMIGRKSSFALLTDANYGTRFIFKGNRIYNSKWKIIPGVTGHLDSRRKTIYLKARDGDVQVLRMKGEKR